MEFLGLLGLLGSLISLVLVGLVVIGILALVGRGEPDPTGRRTYAMYLFAVTFVSLFLTLFTLFAVVQSLVGVILPERGPFAVTVGAQGIAVANPYPEGLGYEERWSAAEPHPGGVAHEGLAVAQPSLSPPARRFVQYGGFDPDRERWRTIVQMGLIAMGSGLVLRWHAARARELVGEPGFKETPAWRTFQAYVHAVCFVAIFLLLFAAAGAVYGLVGAIAPGIGDPLGGGHRVAGVERFVTNGLLAFAAYAIFRYHWALRGLRAEPSPEPSEPAG